MEVLRLKQILKEKNVSGKQLAEKVGVSENTISFIATGKTQPRFELLLQIAKELDVDIRNLFNPTKESSEPIHIIMGKELHTFHSVDELKEFISKEL